MTVIKSVHSYYLNYERKRKRQNVRVSLQYDNGTMSDTDRKMFLLLIKTQHDCEMNVKCLGTNNVNVLFNDVFMIPDKRIPSIINKQIFANIETMNVRQHLFVYLMLCINPKRDLLADLIVRGHKKYTI
jgi:hypothetical protein